MKAVWNNEIIAESTDTVLIEGNHYFPPESVRVEFLVESATITECAWKGTAGYYDIIVDDKVNKDAAWFYPEPKEKAGNIKNHVAFWRGVRIIK